MMHGNVSVADPYGLLRLADAWRNGKALATLLIVFVAVALVGLFVLVRASADAMPIAFALCAALAVFGVTAAASQFAEQAGGRPVSGVARALAAAPRIVLRCALLAGLLAVVLATFVLLAAAILFFCRLPVVGPVLYIVALPTLTMIGAALLLVSTAAALLTLPALWEGHSLRTALSQLYAIAAQRKLSAFANLILFLLVAAVVAVVVPAFVAVAFAMVCGLAVSVSSTIGVNDVLARLAGESPLAGAEPLVVAATIGAALVLAITIALLVATFLFGLAIAYRRSTDGIDIAGARAAFARAVVELQVKKGEAIEEAGSFVRWMLGARGWDSGRAPVSVVSPLAGEGVATIASTATRPVSCARCAARAEPDDVFCGSCGERLSE